MDDLSDAASNIFADEFAALLAMVQQRIQLEWRYHPGRELKSAGFHLLDYAEEFGKLLRIVYRHRLFAALREEASWYAALFTSHGWGQDSLALLVDSWVIAIQGLIKPPECNQLAAPLKQLSHELPTLFKAQPWQPTTMKPSNPALVEALLHGDIRRSRELILHWLNLPRPPEKVIVEEILPAISEIGMRWEQNRAEIYQEHLATEAIKSLLSGFPALISVSPQQVAKTALVSCAPGDQHALISLALSTYFEIRGWQVCNLGGSLPAAQIVLAAEAIRPDLLLLTFTLLSNLDDVLEVVERMFARLKNCQIIVGGHGALSSRPVLERKGCLVAENFDHAYQLAMEGIKDA